MALPLEFSGRTVRGEEKPDSEIDPEFISGQGSQ
jgi:hypothetical protein